MLTILNNQPVSLNTKISLLNLSAQSALGSDYYINLEESWLGDELTIQSLFPQWIIKEYNDNPNNVTIIPIIKNYMRWLLSQDHGYGAQLNWENIRVPLYCNSIFLEAYADFYFPGADFGSAPLNSVIQNLRKFLVQADVNYFNCKATHAGIKYAICSLFDIPWDSITVITANSNVISISLATAYSSSLDSYKDFIKKYLIPVGMSVKYSVI